MSGNMILYSDLQEWQNDTLWYSSNLQEWHYENTLVTYRSGNMIHLQVWQNGTLATYWNGRMIYYWLTGVA